MGKYLNKGATCARSGAAYPMRTRVVHRPGSETMTSILTGGPLRTPTLTDLDERARDIFRRVVETYLETGEPVGSRTLSRGGIQLSPASIRNTLQDLAQLGLL